MSRISFTARIVLAGSSVIFPLTAIVACSGSSDHPAAAAAGGVTPPPGATASGTTPTSEAGAPDDAATCQGVAIVGDPAEEIQIAADEPPPLGGNVVAGMYVLKDLYTYVAPLPPDAGETTPSEKVTGKVATKNVVITGAVIQILDAEGTIMAGVGAAATTGGTFVVGGTDMHVAQTCPSSSAVTYGYTASATGLALYVGERREVYKLIH